MVKCYYIENLGVSDITVDYYLNKNPEKLQLILSAETFIDLCADNDPMPVVVTSEAQYYLYEKGTCVDSVCEVYASTTSTTTICYCVEINNPSTTETGGYVYLNCYGAYVNTQLGPLDTTSICTSDTQITILPMSGANLTTTVIGYCIQNQCTPFPTTTLSTTSWYTTTTTTCGCYTLEWLITGGTATYTWANCSDQTTNSLTVGLLTGNLSGTANICSSITPIMSGNMNPGSTGYTFYTLNGNCGDPICLNPGATTTSTTELITTTTTSGFCQCYYIENRSVGQTILISYIDCDTGSVKKINLKGGAYPNWKYICSSNYPRSNKPNITTITPNGNCFYYEPNERYECITTSTTDTPENTCNCYELVNTGNSTCVITYNYCLTNQPQPVYINPNQKIYICSSVAPYDSIHCSSTIITNVGSCSSGICGPNVQCYCPSYHSQLPQLFSLTNCDGRIIPSAYTQDFCASSFSVLTGNTQVFPKHPCCCSSYRVSNLSRTQTITITFKDCSTGNLRTTTIKGGVYPNWKYICTITPPQTNSPSITSIIADGSGRCGYNYTSNTFTFYPYNIGSGNGNIQF